MNFHRELFIENFIEQNLRHELQKNIQKFKFNGFNDRTSLPTQIFTFYHPQEAERILREQAEAELHESLDEIIDLMQENVTAMGVTLFMPHVMDVATKKTSEAAKWLSMFSRERKMIQITPEMMSTLDYQLENPLDADVMEYLKGKDLLAMLWSADSRFPAEKTLADFVQSISMPQPVEDEEGNRISGQFHPRLLDPLVIYLDDDEKEISVHESIAAGSMDFNSLIPETAASQRTSIATRGGSETTKSIEKESSTLIVDDDRPKLVIPPVWTPANPAGNAIFMHTFFRNVKPRESIQ